MKARRRSVIVVGGGIFGVTAALELCSRGLAVELIDPGPLPHEHASSTDISKAVRMDYGADGFYTELAELALDGWRTWNREWTDPPYHEVGFLLMRREAMAPGTLILNGVPAARPGFQRTQPGDAGEVSRWNLGTVGLIRPCKGIEVLIRAVASLRRRGCPAAATVVGTFYTEQYQREIMELVQQLGVGDLIDFVGFSNDVPAQLENFDLFVMPSVGPEGLPMVLLESMAHSLPTIGSAVAGVGDVVRPGVDGLLFPPGDAEALADAVESFICGEVDWLSMSEAAYDRHANEFSVQRMASEFAKVYRELVELS